MKNYLSDRTHRAKMNALFLYLPIEAPQGSILGQLLLDIYICELFFFIEEEAVPRYADDTSPLFSGTNLLTVLNCIENKVSHIFYCFSKN